MFDPSTPPGVALLAHVRTFLSGDSPPKGILVVAVYDKEERKTAFTLCYPAGLESSGFIQLLTGIAERGAIPTSTSRPTIRVGTEVGVLRVSMENVRFGIGVVGSGEIANRILLESLAGLLLTALHRVAQTEPLKPPSHPEAPVHL